MKHINRIIEYGFYALAFFLPWQTRWIIRAGELNQGYLEYETISLYATDILIILLIFLFVINYFVNQKKLNISARGGPALGWKIQVSNFWWYVAILEFFVFVSIFFAPLKSVAIFSYVRLLFGIGLFWLVINAKYNLNKLSLSFILGAGLQAVLGIWQFVTQSTFACKYLGMASHDPRELGTAVIEIIASDGIGERWLRAYGALDHPNILGAYLVIAIFLLLGLFINNKKETNNKYYYSLWLFLLLGVFVSFSRTAWLALVAGFIGLLIMLIWQKRLLVQKKLLQLVLMGSVIGFIFVCLYGNLVSARFNFDNRLEQKSVFERVAGLEQGKKVASDNLFFGVGINNFPRALTVLEPGERSWYYQPIHNTYLLVLAEIGIFGFISFILLVFYIKPGKRYSQSKDIYNFGIYISLIALLFFDHFWWSLHFGVLLFWFILGLKYKEE